MNKIKTCIIGCGSIAGGMDDPESNHVLTHAKGITKHPNFELVACYDSDFQKAQSFKARWGGEVLQSTKELTERSIDLYVIASSTNAHFEALKQTLTSSCSGIIIEKPIVSNLSEFETISPLLLNTSKKIVVNFTRRFDHSHLELKKILSSNPFGALLHFHASVAKGLVHNGAHMIDLLFFLTEGVEGISPSKFYIKDSDLYGNFKVKLKNGVDGVVFVAESVKYSLFELDLIFESGRVSLKDIGYEITSHTPSPSPIYPGFNYLKLDQTLPPTLNLAFYNLYDLYATNQIDFRLNLGHALSGSKLLLELKNSVINKEKVCLP